MGALLVAEAHDPHFAQLSKGGRVPAVRQCHHEGVVRLAQRAHIALSLCHLDQPLLRSEEVVHRGDRDPRRGGNGVHPHRRLTLSLDDVDGLLEQTLTGGDMVHHVSLPW